MTVAEEAGAARPAYSAYQDSGVPWIGEIPVGWEVRRLKYGAKVVNTRTEVRPAELRYLGLEHLESGTGKLTDLPEPSQVESMVALFEAGDVLFGKLRPYLAKVHRAEAAGCSSTEMVAFRVGPAIDPRFLKYWLLSPGYIDAANRLTFGSKMPRVSPEQLSNLPLLVPPVLEQQAIAAFLDRETDRIDELLREQEGLLEDLALRRAALVFEGTTKGFGGAPLRDSGAAWAGQVPAHWEFVNLRSVARLESGHTPSRSKPEYWEDCTIPWVSLSDVRRFRDGRLKYIEDTEEKISELGMANSAARLLPKGTVILSRTASVGFSAILGTDMATTQDFANWVCGPRLLPGYLLYVLRGMKHEFARLMMGSTHQTIYMPDIRELQVPLPPLAEQQAIVDHLDTQLAQIDALTEEVRASIALMRQHRSALITAAVTGKIDVRDQVTS